MTASKTYIRCPWCGADPLYVSYHDEEWGVPIFDDLKLFEFLILEGAQAGLSWLTVLRKRENYRVAFDHFDPEKIARYTDADLAELQQNSGIIRNRLKIQAARTNARAFLEIVEKHSSFSSFLWRYFSDGPISNSWHALSEVPATTALSDLMSKELKKSGFTFVGSTICYAFMQAVGMVNDHLVNCFRYQEVRALAKECSQSQPG